MAETAHVNYRIEQHYRTALKLLAQTYHEAGRIRHPSEANAIRVLIEEEMRRQKLPLERDDSTPG